MTFQNAVEEALRRLGVPDDEIQKTGQMATREIRLQEGSKADFIFQDIPLKPGVTDEGIIQAFMLLFRDKQFVAECERSVRKKRKGHPSLMTYREAAAIAFKECGLSQEEFDAAASITDARSMGTNWTSASHGQIPAGQERAQIDEIKLLLNGGESREIPSGRQVVAELERIRGSN